MKRERRVLFVCRANRNRSPTAERVFGEMLREWGCTLYDPLDAPEQYDFQVTSAGYWADEDARQLDQESIDDSEIVFALDPGVAAMILRDYRIPRRKLVTLQVPDIYRSGAPALVAILREQLAPFRKLIKRPTAKPARRRKRNTSTV